MGSGGRTASIDELSQEMLKKGDVRALYNGDNLDNNEISNAMRIFVGGLPADLTVEEFKAYFQKFGSIEDVVVISDKETRRPRGFGFVTFNSPETANNVLKNRFYELKNKRVEVKKAISKERMSRNFGNYYDAVYTGNTLPFAASVSYGNFGGYYYGMNQYDGFRAYNGLVDLGYEGLSYIYYPHQSLSPSYYANNRPYQSWYYYADAYSHQSPYYYGNTPYGSKHSHKYRNRTPIVVKTNSNVKDGDDFVAVTRNASSLQKFAALHLGSNVGKEKGDTECDRSRSRDSNNEESVATHVLANGDGDHAEIGEGLSLHCNGDNDGLGSDDVGKEKGDTKYDHSRSRDSNDEESVVTHVLANSDGDHAEITKGLTLHFNGDSNGGCAKVIRALSL